MTQESTRLDGITELGLYYLAGVLDASATVGTTTHRPDGRNEYRYASVRVGHPNKALLDWLVEITGLGGVSLAVRKSKQRQASWRYSANAGTAVALLTRVAPYLRNPDLQKRVRQVLKEAK